MNIQTKHNIASSFGLWLFKQTKTPRNIKRRVADGTVWSLVCLCPCGNL